MFRFILVNILMLVVLVFFTQNSLIVYIEQRFHSSFGLDELLKGSAFSKGAEIFRAFGVFVDTSANVILENKSQSADGAVFEINKQNDSDIMPFDDNITEEELTKENISVQMDDENASADTAIIEQSPDDKIVLKQGDSVLITGDSMMQYIGIAARQNYPKLGLKVLDLSKHSTGLLDKKSHNWAQVIKDTLAKNKDIKLLVMLIGANDPWGRSVNGKFYKLNSPEWREFYTGRVDEIYKIAKASNVKVLWLSLPCMKKTGYAKKTQLLNEIYKSASEQNGQIFINTSEYLCQNDEYKTHIDINGKRSKIRQDDGIHISKIGSQILAGEILKRIEIE
ncbi:MAG: hypothetical protein SPE49_05155 [Campylobacter sp.]|uniref:SGNH/GDSL hydrolase family protein n=1 Tax=Campylobacter sp. TaxID=205 RepID=UPI002A837B30|nr:hypothetical protein [Campylobacter sp.]MCI7587810.1 hypothetical protein [Campylobacter sp.]MDY5115336.1 hypothetical protein [Campylobacter sp.]